MCYLNASHFLKKKKNLNLPLDLYPGPPGEQPNAVTIEQSGYLQL